MARKKSAGVPVAPPVDLTLEAVPVMALSKGFGGVFGLDFDDAGPDTPRPTSVDDSYILLVADRDDRAHFAPSTYWFDGSTWRSQDQTSNDTVGDSTVVAWARLPRSIRVRLT